LFGTLKVQSIILIEESDWSLLMTDFWVNHETILSVT